MQKVLRVLACVLLLCGPASAQVGFIAGNGASSQLVSTLDTGALTIGAESNKALAACVSWNAASDTVSTVVWDPTGVNQALSSVAAAGTVGNRRVQCFCRINPSAVTGGIVRVTWTGSTIGSQAVFAAGFSGADQTTPCQDFTSASGTSAGPITVTVPNATANDFVMDTVITGASIDTIGANQTQIGTTGAPGDNHAASRQDGADGGVMSWTLFFSDTWLTGGVRIVAAGGGGGGGGVSGFRPLMGGVSR